jgi:hypothetical protein
MRRSSMAEFSKRPTPQEFIEGAVANEDLSEEIAQPEKGYPWESCNPQIQKYFNLRINEVTLAKLRFINEHRPGSIQQWVRGVIEEAIENGIREILQEQR